jgi:hypothetical protein
MSDNEFAWLENVLGAGGEEDAGNLVGARCPSCKSEEFIKISDLYAESRARLEDPESVPGAPPAGITDEEVVRRYARPKKASPAPRTALAAAITGGIAYWIFRRFGEPWADIAGIAALVVTASVLLSRMRAVSDDHYHRRTKWNRLYMCRKCGTVVAA